MLRKLKVLHVIPSMDIADGGPTVAMATIANSLRERVILTVATTASVQPSLTKLPSTAAVLRFVRQLRFYKVSLPLLFWLWKHVRTFDVIHVHALFSFAPIVASACAVHFSVPLVIRPLGVLNNYGRTNRRSMLKRLSIRLIEGPLLRRAAAVHFTSEQEAIESRQLGFSLRENVIPLSVVTEPKGDPELFVREFPMLSGRRVLLYLARLDPVKNLESLLVAFSQVSSQHPELCLLICGTGDQEYVKTLKNLAKQLKLDDVVVWAGAVHGANKTGAFAVAQVYILPSLSENFGIAVVEAMAAGKPVIVSKGVPMHELIVQAGAGWAVSPEPQSISSGILAAFADSSRLTLMGQSARALAEREYSEAAMGERLQTMYERIAN